MKCSSQSSQTNFFPKPSLRSHNFLAKSITPSSLLPWKHEFYYHYWMYLYNCDSSLWWIYPSPAQRQALWIIYLCIPRHQGYTVFLQIMIIQHCSSIPPQVCWEKKHFMGKTIRKILCFSVPFIRCYNQKFLDWDIKSLHKLQLFVHLFTYPESVL